LLFSSAALSHWGPTEDRLVKEIQGYPSLSSRYFCLEVRGYLQHPMQCRSVLQVEYRYRCRDKRRLVPASSAVIHDEIRSFKIFYRLSPTSDRWQCPRGNLKLVESRGLHPAVIPIVALLLVRPAPVHRFMVHPLKFGLSVYLPNRWT
jgi:hypothetical protein